MSAVGKTWIVLITFALAAAGCTGADGEDGKDGVSPDGGAQGPEGPEGPAGPEGAPGRQGVEGPEGPAGGAGPAGPVGPEGPGGPAGEAGGDGPAGPAGPAGPEGPAGPAGENGENGQDGPAGPVGPSGVNTVHVVATPPESLSVHIDEIVIESPPVVRLTVTDGLGRRAVGIAPRSMRFTLAKLMPGANGDPDGWQSYVNSARGGVTAATYDRDGELVDHGDGTYQYTFVTDVTAAVDPVSAEPIEWAPGLTHRLAGQISGGELPVVNFAYDFVPDGGEITLRRDIVMTASCNECHGRLVVHGSRIEARYCVTCHNPGTSNGAADMPVMVHKIHRGINLPSVVAGGTYELGGHDYSHVGYPQDVRNCRKCHNGDDEGTPQGDNWRTKPNRAACGACHDDIDFAAGQGHLRVADNSRCGQCHAPEDITTYHTTENATPNNPELPEGVSPFGYELISVTVDDAGHPTIAFNVTRAGERVDLLDLPADIAAGNRWPGFLLAFALPQGGIVTPADYNNLGNSAAQPASVDIGTVVAGDAGEIVDSGEHFTATLTAAFPAGSTLRAVALQGYFIEVVGGESVSRHTRSVVMAVADDAVRRTAVEMDKCLDCHETFEAHGGNRVDDPQVCAVCHVPNLSSSGRTVDLLHPEETQNLKDLIHGIHASGVRATPYEHARNFRGAANVYDWSHVTFPGVLDQCMTCHAEETFLLPLDENTLPTTGVTTDGVNAAPEDVAAARDTVPNPTDLITSPQAAACSYCHDGDLVLAHIEQNGGAVRWTREAWEANPPVETCAICHGPGALADVALVHGR